MPEKILTESVVAATVIANFVSVDVGTALQLSRIRSLILGLDCDGRKAAPALDRTSHPTNMTIGSDPLFREHTGALASNSMIMCAVFVGHGGVAAGYGLKKGISWSEAASKLEFPSKSITIVLYFFQPMVTSGLYLTVYAQDLGGRVAGIATLVVAACIIGGVALLTLGQMFSAVYIVFDDNESDDVKPAVFLDTSPKPTESGKTSLVPNQGSVKSSACSSKTMWVNTQASSWWNSVSACYSPRSTARRSYLRSIARL